MNEFEKLEAELKELQPAAPSEQFISRLEDALGDAGNAVSYTHLTLPTILRV